MKPAAQASIKRRLILCLAVLSIISVVQVGVASFLQYTLYRNGLALQLLNDVATRQMLGDMKHDSIQGDVFRMIDAIRRNETTEMQKAQASLTEDIGVIDQAYGFVLTNTREGPLAEQSASTVDAKGDYVAKARAFAQAAQDHPQDYGRELEAYMQAFDSFEKVQEDLANAIQKEIVNNRSAASWIVLVSAGTTLLTIIAGAAALAWSGQFVWRSIIQPIERLAAGLLRMSHGDYAVQLDGREDGDEIAQMGAAAGVFRATALAKEAAERDQQAVVAALSTGLAMLADKKLDHQITETFPPSYEQLRQNYNSATHALGEALGSVRIGADTVATAIAEIRVAADDLSRRNEQQAASLEETSAAMTEVTTSVAETAQGAMTVRETVQLTQREATEGGEVVSEAVQAMAAIEDSAQKISRITGVIDEIAFQTNLLALNAGVEAARAGEAGKGFAVVANEVRALAQRSSDAARDIKGLIDTSAAQVSSGVTLVAATGEKLGKIVARVDEVTTLINGIATAAEHQAGKLRQVNSAVIEMDRVTQQNAAMVEQTTAVAHSLSSEAEQLTQLVDGFEAGGARGFARPAMTRPSLSAPPMHAPDPVSRPAQQPASRPAAAAPRVVAAPAPRSTGNLALKADDDWSAF